MHADASVALDLAQLLQLRHMPVPSWHNTPDANGAWLGAFKGRQRGQGTDYDDLRTYYPGDDVRHIDWRASARSRNLQTRIYREEKEHRTTVICDFRDCMFTGSTQLRANRAAVLSTRLLWLACRGGSRVTLIILTPQGFNTIAPGTGHETVINACVLLCQEHASRVKALQPTKTGAQTTHTATHDPLERVNQQWNKRTKDSAALWTRTQALPVNETLQGPTLESLLQWLVIHNEHKSTMLWVTGLDFEGEGFTTLLGELKYPSVSVVSHIDDPMLHSLLPTGEYHFQLHGSTKGNSASTIRHAHVSSRTAHHVKQRIARLQQERTQRFDANKVAWLSAASGDETVLAALRQQGYLP